MQHVQDLGALLPLFVSVFTVKTVSAMLINDLKTNMRRIAPNYKKWYN